MLSLCSGSYYYLIYFTISHKVFLPPVHPSRLDCHQHHGIQSCLQFLEREKVEEKKRRSGLSLSQPPVNYWYSELSKFTEVGGKQNSRCFYRTYKRYERAQSLMFLYYTCILKYFYMMLLRYIGINVWKSQFLKNITGYIIYHTKC